jgi:hypothetical protein
MPFRNQNRNASSEIFYNEKGSHSFQNPQERFHSTSTIAKAEQIKLVQNKEQAAAQRLRTLEFRQDRGINVLILMYRT